MHVPRGQFRTNARDLAALTFVGRFSEVMGYELDALLYRDRSTCGRCRFGRRWQRRGFLASVRFNGFGVNRYRLTAKGREYLIAKGVDGMLLTAPRKPIASKDLAHHTWVVDLAVVLSPALPKSATLVPAEILQRRDPRPAAIPDLLLTIPARGKRPTVEIAFEVDLGGESLKSVFLPKLVRLGTLLAADPVHAALIVVFTSSARRAKAIREALAVGLLPAALLVEELPQATGKDALEGLRKVLFRSARSPEHLAEAKSLQTRDILAEQKPEAASWPCVSGNRAKESDTAETHLQEYP